MKSIWVIAHDAAVAAELVRGAKGFQTFVGAVSLGGEAVPGADLTLTTPAGAGMIEGYAQPIADLVVEQGARLVLFGSDTQSRLLAGAVASRLRTSARAIAGIEVQGDAVTVTRTIYGGLGVATEELGEAPGVLVVGAGALPETDAAMAPGEARPWDATPSAPGLRVVETRPKHQQVVNLASAKRVVGVGRGFAEEADLDLANQLAAKLGAEIACSRPIAEGVNWLPVERYLGVSGARIRPDLYVAIGISGQIQHMAGVSKAKTIIAINKDKNAPIFAQADYGVVGDLYEVLPALVQAL
ncbi:MAG: electron transfer flavoprotein subunit alpha/FixB family protein [Propionibacteriaceae bacterium]|nr:electron transfer flavoprotein subunit alpha/FixB family protein [Propionibacteriaceae bacterium]